MQLRVLIVVEPGLAGVFRHAEGLCDFVMSNRDVHVGLAYSSRRDSAALKPFVERVARRGGPVVDLGVDNRPSLRDVGALRSMARLLREFEPHVIHSHSSKAGALARGLWATGVGLPQFYTPNAYYGLNKGSGGMALVYDAIEGILGRIGTTINVSGSERAFARHRLMLPLSTLTLIPNAVDCDRFRAAEPAERAESRRGVGIPVDAWVFGTVGRYSAQKDPLTLYRSVEKVLKEDDRAWFAHLGEGEQVGEVDALLRGQPFASRVVRIPYMDDTARFYRMLDAFVLSSRYEGLPLSAIEALAVNLPMALTRCPGCLDFAAMGLSHVTWASIEDPVSLAEAVGELRHIQQGNLNHRVVAERLFGVDAVYGRIYDAYLRSVADDGGVRV